MNTAPELQQDTLQSFTLENGWRVYAVSKEALDAGEFYLSVTTVLSIVADPKLNRWRENNSKNKIEKTLATTADIGTRIHTMVENDLTRNAGAIEPELQVVNDNWQEIKTKYQIVPSLQEQVAWSEKHGFAGRYDGIAEIKGTRTLYDIKSGWYNITAGWQTCAYRGALIEQGMEEDSLGAAVIHLHRDGTQKGVFVYSHYESCYTAFLSALNVFRMKFFNELKKLNWKWVLHCPLQTKE